MKRISDFFAQVIPRLWDWFPPPRMVRRAIAIVCLLATAALLIIQPDSREDLRVADRLFLAGQYHDALVAYNAVSAQFAEAQLRLGMLRVLRGEPAAAERALHSALQRGLRPGLYQQALLFLGRAQADDGRAERAAATWSLIEDCRSSLECAYRGPARVLLAEAALQRGDYPAAEAALRAALDAGLPMDWAGLVHYRLALLQIPRDPLAARHWLETMPEDAAPQVWIAPLLANYGDGAAQLAAVLDDRGPHQAQQLGQIYLSLGWYGLAEAQFAQVDPNGADALGAAAYAAYTRYRAGDVSGGLARLEALVQANPDEPRARTLLALSYLAAEDADAAAAQLDTVAELTPNNPDVQLAWASWYAAEHNYAEAALAYGRAIAQRRS
ncbi:MAG: tetratricopeptide repeat protein [Oscillochloris sp.]|nr:tetratricopeptide repeat protein [Oscillochloris sp.]